MNSLNLSKSSEKLVIATLLEERLKDDNSIFGFGCKNGLKVRDIEGVFEMVADQWVDNDMAIYEMIGEELTYRIVKYLKTRNYARKF